MKPCYAARFYLYDHLQIRKPQCLRARPVQKIAFVKSCDHDQNDLAGALNKIQYYSKVGKVRLVP